MNHAGASPAPRSVTERVLQHLELEQNLGGYAAAALVEDEVQQVYQSAAKLIHADPSEIALVESATVAWTRAFYSMAQKQHCDVETKGKKVILICDAEYAANVVAACQWARDHQSWTVLSIPSQKREGKSTGIVDLQALDDMLSGTYSYNDEKGNLHLLDPSRIAMACITHIPTNSGIVNPVEEIGHRISAYNLRHDPPSKPPILYLVDTCQAVGHLCVNVQTIQCHALVATGRKYLRGPRGTGFLFVSSNIVNELIPSHIDHYGVPISKVPTNYQDGDAVQSRLDFVPRVGASRFEFWESNVANRLGLGVAIRHAMDQGLENIEQDCRRLSRILRERLAQVPSIIIHHEYSTSCGIVTFYSTVLDSKGIKGKMMIEGFELSVVPATSTPLDSSMMKVPDLVRASLLYTNTEKEIDDFCQSLASLLQLATSVGSVPE
jgi:selenocysteine lyase/cysteine desulfurase